MNIRLKGVSAREAQGLPGDLGSELLRRLTQRQEFSGKGTVKIGTVDAGTLQTGGNECGPGLQRKIADRAAEAIASYVTKNNKR